MFGFNDDIYCDEEYGQDTTNAITEFKTSVEAFIESIEKYKKDYSKDLDTYWKPEYSVIRDKFYEIREMIEYNWLDAKEEVDKIPCFKYENFAQYVFNTDLKNTKHIKGNSVRPKTIRRKRNNFCPICKIECVHVNTIDMLKCPKCGHEIIKEKAGGVDNVINNEKHIRKQLDKLVGLTKIPNNVKKLLPYLITWLTEWKHIKEWLIYAKRIDDFMFHYYSRFGEHMTLRDFDKVLPRTENNKLPFCVYELFVEEFYKLTEIAQTTARKISNMNLDDKTIMKIIKSYLKDHNKTCFNNFIEVPDETVIYNYNGNNYSIGIYLGKLALIPNYDEHHIKYKIVKAFCRDGVDCITLPGLIYNYSDIFSTSDNIPRSFNYSENYNKIMNEVFHSQYSIIPQYDIDKFVGIFKRFNEYYKTNIDKCGKKKNTKTNSPLFVCTIKCILTSFSYFHKYINILEQTSHRITESVTKNEIDNLWVKFITEESNKDLLEMYDKDEDETQKEDKQEYKNDDLNELL